MNITATGAKSIKKKQELENTNQVIAGSLKDLGSPRTLLKTPAMTRLLI